MSELSKCRACHKLVSTSASSCPYCGEPFPTLTRSCPNCGSTTSAAPIGKQGFSASKAIGGAILLGPLGLAAGAVASNHIVFVCKKCGYRWKVNPADLEANVSSASSLQIGDILTGSVVEIKPQARIDLGENRWGTLMNLTGINRKRKRQGKSIIGINDQIRVRVTDKPLKASWAYMLGYALVLEEDSLKTSVL